MMVHRYIGCAARWSGLVLALIGGSLAFADADYRNLSIGDVVDLALAADPEILTLQLQADAEDKLKEAAKHLPEPTVRTGFSNVPLDSFALNQEPMTQAVIGVRQTIPAIGSRLAMSTNHEHLSEALGHQASIRARAAGLASRNAWLEAHYQRNAVDLTEQSAELLENLTAVVRARYATGDELQLAVLAAELELNGMQSRVIDTKRHEFRSLNELKRLLGITQTVSIARELPMWDSVPSESNLIDALVIHPRVQAADAAIASAAAKIRFRETALKPAWHFDLSYGARDGDDIRGERRSDFASATLSFSLPLIAKRQHILRLDAAHASEESARVLRSKVIRDMTAEVAVAYSEWRRLSERLDLLDETIVAQAHNHAEAALKAYQNKEGSFADVLLSYVKEVDAKLEQQRVRIDRLKAWATIDSLNGSTK